MKYKKRGVAELIAIGIVYLFILISILILGIFPFFAVADGVGETSVATPEKTTITEINRLSTKYGVDKELITAIISCEGGFDGNAVHKNLTASGEVWSLDYGPLQINDYYQADTMARLGLDITNQWDSLEYGFILFTKQGSSPWSASRKCWLPKYQIG